MCCDRKCVKLKVWPEDRLVAQVQVVTPPAHCHEDLLHHCWPLHCCNVTQANITIIRPSSERIEIGPHTELLDYCRSHTSHWAPFEFVKKESVCVRWADAKYFYSSHIWIGDWDDGSTDRDRISPGYDASHSQDTKNWLLELVLTFNPTTSQPVSAFNKIKIISYCRLQALQIIKTLLRCLWIFFIITSWRN